MMELGCEVKSMYPIDKSGKSPSPLPLFHLLPTFLHLRNCPGWVCLTMFSCSRLFWGPAPKKKAEAQPPHTPDAPAGPHTLSSRILLTFPKPSPTSTLSKSGHPALPHHPPEGCPVLSHRPQAASSVPGGQLSPDVFGGCLAVLLDGGALIFVVQPSCSLAGPVAVVGELALATAVEPLLPFEAGVTDDVRQAGRTEGPVGSYLGEGRASSTQQGFCQLFVPGLPTATKNGLPEILGEDGETSHPA